MSLNLFFDECLISDRRWPPRSPDMSSLDFFLLGYLKEHVYANKPEALDALKQNIPKKLMRFRFHATTGFQKCGKAYTPCLLANGGQFEHIL